MHLHQRIAALVMPHETFKSDRPNLDYAKNMNLEWISELLNMTKYSNPVDLDFDSMPNETLWTDIKDCKAQMHFLFLYNTGSCGDDDEACDFYNTVPSEKTFYNDEIAMREDDDDWVWKGQDTGVYIYQVDPISV